MVECRWAEPFSRAPHAWPRPGPGGPSRAAGSAPPAAPAPPAPCTNRAPPATAHRSTGVGPAAYTRSATTAGGSRSVRPRPARASPGSVGSKPTLVQFTSRSPPASARSATSTPRSAPSARARSGVRLTTATRAAPASASAQATARAEPPAPRTVAVMPRTSRSRAARNPGASVFSAAIAPPSPKLSVLAAPMASAARERVSASASAASLWGTVTFSPRKPDPGSALTVSANNSGGTGTRT